MSFFLNGYAYDRHDGRPREKACDTCAFKAGVGSVRPEGVSIADVEDETADCDDFVCHTANADGTYPSCAGWYARFGKLRPEALPHAERVAAARSSSLPIETEAKGK